MVPTKVLGDLIAELEQEVRDIKFNMSVYGWAVDENIATRKLARLERELVELNEVYDFIAHHNEVTHE